MADPKRKRSENVPGPFFVDETCIDCGMCFWMVPGVFTEVGDMAAVTRQPRDDAETFRAAQALVSCPAGSIGGDVDRPVLTRAIASFPFPVDGNVHHCGYHSRDSFGAASYLVVRPEGNVLVDSPRFATPLVKRIEALGGVRYLFLTHRDDVADHAKFRAHFGCERVLHADDVTSSTRDVEIQLTGQAPFRLDDTLVAYPVPGHTRGHAVLAYDETYLFTGDHLAWSPQRGHLIAFRDACWDSWPRQIESMKRLLGVRFSWVLPGHGFPHAADPAAMRASLEACIAWMESRA